MWWPVLVSLLAAGGYCLEGEMAEMAKMIREECVGETGVDTSLLEQVDGGADLMPDGKLKCYIKCTMETAGMFSDGEVDVEAVVALLPEALASSAAPIRSCATKKGADDCDTAYLTQQCWQRSNKADYFLI